MASSSSSSSSSSSGGDTNFAGFHTFEVLGTSFTVDRKYAPIKALGKGAYGVVCAAKNRETGAKVAIKRISPMCATPTDGKHTLREIRLMRWLGKHANIISLKDLIVHAEPGGADELYVVMELFDTDLHRIIQSPQPLGDAHYKHFIYQVRFLIIKNQQSAVNNL
jgi:serine/threonine protein kinase